jgi:ssDNA-binding Zn-finger/Zn-ribbon topoisomerase 1
MTTIYFCYGCFSYIKIYFKENTTILNIQCPKCNATNLRIEEANNDKN